ncbi:MAG: VTT domain-containing protein [Planctomycetaceae bacterium]|nr:VTT domain-containing protein [Planctomycetaceae bacterium]
MIPNQEQRCDVEPRRGGRGRLVVALVVFGITAAAIIHRRHDLPGLVATLRDEAWGPALALVLFIPAVLATAPVSWLTVLVGYVFGFVRGAVIGSLGGLIGATAAFSVSRWLLHAEVRRWWSQTRLFQSLERELGARGVRLIVLARISPVVSCSLLSYLCGATRLSLPRFLVGTWLGMAPGSIVYAWVGSSLHDWSDANSSMVDHPHARALWIVGLIATIVIAVQLSRAVRGLLEQQLADDR